MNRVISTVVKVIGIVVGIFTKTNTVAAVIAPQLKNFVVSTAEAIEQWIPDSGFGDTKIVAFDGALKIFIDEMKNNGDLKDDDVNGVWELAHVLLEGYLAAKKAKQSVK